MKKKLFWILTCILGFSFLTISLSSAELVQEYGPPELTILDFVLVSSNQTGNILIRTFKLKVKNTGEESIYNVRATLIHTSDQATIDEGEVFLGAINSGEMLTSDDDFTYSVDMSKTDVIPEIDLHWKVEYENGGRYILGEAQLTDKL